MPSLSCDSRSIDSIPGAGQVCSQGPAILFSALTTNLFAPAKNLQSIKDDRLISLLRNVPYPTASTCYLY